MNVFLVVLEDRHIGVRIEVFSSHAGAMERACQIVDEYAFTPEEPDVCPVTWSFLRTLSCEGDYVHVEKATVIENQERGRQ